MQILAKDPAVIGTIPPGAWLLFCTLSFSEDFPTCLSFPIRAGSAGSKIFLDPRGCTKVRVLLKTMVPTHRRAGGKHGLLNTQVFSLLWD